MVREVASDRDPDQRTPPNVNVKHGQLLAVG
jgi:hypothetical protein